MAAPGVPPKAEQHGGEDRPAVASSFSSGGEAHQMKETESLPLGEKREESPGEALQEPDDSSIEPVPLGEAVYTTATFFEDLTLRKELIRGLYTEMGFKRPSKAHHGSGKTTCFVLSMLSRVDPTKKNETVLTKMGKYTGITSVCAIPSDASHYSPVAKPPVTEQVLIATPGTVNRWVMEKSTREMKILVFDEADHLPVEDGFRDDALKVTEEIERSSPHCQGGVEHGISALVLGYLRRRRECVHEEGRWEANQLYMKEEELTLEKVKHYKIHCPNELAKIYVIMDKIFNFGEKVGQTIIFVNVVVNYDLSTKYDAPMEPDFEVYLHRVGRTSCFGIVFNLLCWDSDKTIMERIEQKPIVSIFFQVPDWRSEDFKAALNSAGLL
ncbi:unnamed protein product [Spirodela intermedia]|uniref:DEAD/DEAH-box helicase domain-containing protein n=1 Tax=Spirodela intermedia TaxID=51605 RepID=A0A7I8JH54_SPIIN|nr:unnamed protein product [Spirodela intermedia]CAA6669466.1 unnamed protein product [Spirodela intermedia]